MCCGLVVEKTSSNLFSDYNGNCRKCGQFIGTLSYIYVNVYTSESTCILFVLVSFPSLWQNTRENEFKGEKIGSRFLQFQSIVSSLYCLCDARASWREGVMDESCSPHPSKEVDRERPKGEGLETGVTSSGSPRFHLALGPVCFTSPKYHQTVIQSMDWFIHLMVFKLSWANHLLRAPSSTSDTRGGYFNSKSSNRELL